ncbi:MAG: PRD domain-containing protein [Candidatus Cellulosilyticum pullistercoris]|uniref:PRD domain-containing protein n=1 Tax=Candidatus Cellulosilyticum pullistercoris TaxID=2838521 RepID=A0A9E2NLH7_9FIRM|nr:PRD domain-containing protein [Candidatus Cellulosilyticum pullistercoris]
MLSARQEFILITLLNTAKTVEMDFLCEKLSISERTLKEDLKGINHFLEVYELDVKYTNDSRYYIEEDKKEKLTKILKDYENICQWIPETPSQRQFLIMFLLLWEERPITMDEMSEKLFVSRSCIFHDIKQLNEFVKQITGTELEVSKAIGIQFKAIEVVKRKLISALIYKHYRMDANYLMRVFLHFGLGTREQYRQLVLLYQKHLNERHIVLADYGFITLILENLAFAGRVKAGYIVDDFYVEECKESIVPFDALESILDVTFNEEERYWLQYIFMQKRIIYIGQNSIVEDEAKIKDEITYRFVDSVKEKHGIDMRRAPEQLLDLERHIKAMLSRIKLNDHEDAYMAKKIKKQAQSEYAIAGEIVPIIEELTGIRITDIEHAYIALHIATILEHLKKTVHAILVSNSAAIMIKRLKSKIEQAFHGKIRIEGYYSTHQIDYALEHMEHIDLILATHTLKQKVNIPVINLHEIFTHEDWESITRYMKNV